MKVFWGILLLASSALAVKVQLRDGIVPQKLPAFQFRGNANNASRAALDEIKKFVETTGKDEGRYIEVDLSRFARIIINVLERLVIENGLDPLELPSTEISYVPGSALDLSNGWFVGLSTLDIHSALIGRFSRDTRILEINLPLTYEQLVILYDYQTRVGLVTLRGDIVAKVTDFRLNLRVGFDFNTLHVFADDIDVTDTGAIDVEITGLGAFEYIADLIIDTITESFHGIILEVVNFALQIPINAAVNAINNVIDAILGRDSAESAW